MRHQRANLMAMQDRDELLKPPAVAALLGIHQATLAGWRTEEGRGPRFIKVGRHVRYRRSDIEAWLETRTCSSTRTARRWPNEQALQ